MVSRLSDLLRQLGTRDAELANDLEREVAAIAGRRAFGLNFERHVPELVELPARRVRRGDKVRVLAPRGGKDAANPDLWRVLSITTDGQERRALIQRLDETDQVTVDPEDLVVVAEFRDP